MAAFIVVEELMRDSLITTQAPVGRTPRLEQRCEPVLPGSHPIAHSGRGFLVEEAGGLGVLSIPAVGLPEFLPSREYFSR